jgi:hypothetical protein
VPVLVTTRSEAKALTTRMLRSRVQTQPKGMDGLSSSFCVVLSCISRDLSVQRSLTGCLNRIRNLLFDAANVIARNVEPQMNE